MAACTASIASARIAFALSVLDGMYLLNGGWKINNPRSAPNSALANRLRDLQSLRRSCRQPSAIVVARPGGRNYIAEQITGDQLWYGTLGRFQLEAMAVSESITKDPI